MALIRSRVAPGQLLFRSVNRRNFNRQLKAIMANLHVPVAARYSSHAFRRGATQELKEAGSPWSAIAASGVWHSTSFRGYIDLSRDVELGARYLFDVDFDSESGSDEVHRWVLFQGKPLGRPSPAACPWVTGFPASHRWNPGHSCAHYG